SPPPGGSSMLWTAVGGAPGVMTRKLAPPSTDPSQALRWVPVPVGPLTNTPPDGSIPMLGSPNVWMGSATVGTPNAMEARGAPDDGVARTDDASAASARVNMRRRARLMGDLLVALTCRSTPASWLVRMG